MTLAVVLADHGANLDLLVLGYQTNSHVTTANSMHVLIAKKNLL